MSRAFVKEGDGDDEGLPDREIPPHANYVTQNGLALIDAELARHSRLETVTQSQTLRPQDWKRTFITALSIPTDDASTPQPTYAMFASSNRP